MNYKGNDKYGALPRRTMIANQPHMLAYINPQEEMLLRQLGGAGEPVGPMGIPAYYFGMGGQEQPSENFGYDAPGNGGGGGNTSVGSYNAAVSRASQPLSRDYNATDRNRDLATISSYNATATTSAPVEVEVAPVSIDSGMGAAISANDGVSFTDSTSVPTSNIGVNTGLSGEEFNDIGLVNTTGSGSVSAGAPENDFDFGMGSDDGVGTSAGEGDVGITIDPYDNPYAIDITDTNIYTENPDGTYTVEDGEPDPIEIDEPDPIINTGFPENPEEGPPDDFEPPVNEPEPTVESEYFNLFRSTAPSSWLRNSIWSSVGTGPDFDVDVYQEADGSLRFRETGELVPEEYMKYIDLARRTEMKAPGEEEDIVDVDTVVEPLDDDTMVEPLDDDTVVDTVVETITPSSTAITNQASDGSDMTDMTTIVEGPTDYSMNPDAIESTIEDRLSDRALGYYDLISSGEKSLYEVNEQSLYNRRNRNPISRQAAQDAVNEYLYNNLTPDELRAWQDGQFNPITDPTSSVYNPQGIPEGLL